MKRLMLALAGALWLVATVSPARAKKDEKAPPAPIGTQVAELPDARVVERVIEGRLLAAAVLPESLGQGLAVLLLRNQSTEATESTEPQAGADQEPEEDDETPREVWALFADPDLPPRLLAGNLLPSLDDLEIHRGVTAERDELWLGGAGIIYRLDGEAQTATAILAAPGLDLGVLEQTGLLNVGGGVAIPELGRLRVLDAELRETVVLPLPVSAQRRTSGLVLSSPNVVRPRAADMPYLAGPEPQGPARLLVRVFDPAVPTGEDGEPAQTEAWIRLPAPEDIERGKFIVLDGVPRLAILTTDAEKLGIFEEMGFRLYALRPDRTRGGVGPLLQVQTVTKHWFIVGIEVTDLNQDGKDDLVLLQPEGLGGGDLVIDVYLGLGDGRVAIGGKRRSKLSGAGGHHHWGDDFTGDGVPDLVIAGSDGVQLLAGDKDHRSRVLQKRAVWSWKPDELKAAMRRVNGDEGPMPPDHYRRVDRLRVHDLDGDGRPDLSLVSGGEGRVVVRFVLPRH